MLHELKLHPKYYDDVLLGKKRFELRKDDREYKVGDLLCFYEYANGEYTGRKSDLFSIHYILRNCPKYGLKKGYCILGL